MQNNLFDLNQIVAICTLFKSFNSKLHGGTGLHINIGANYLEGNKKAIENLLLIWGECEELFFKIANAQGETIRVMAKTMATPIKENIEDFFETNCKIKFDNEEDIERFLYQIQAKNRMDTIISWSNIIFNNDLYNNDLEGDLRKARTDEEKFQIYRRYEKCMRDKGDTNSKIRWTSINFNHMKFNNKDPGRIEIRIFNSSLDPEIIFQNLLLIGKLFEICLKNAKDPNYKKDKFEKLFLKDVTETKKLNNLLNLLFDNKEQREIFKSRWRSVRKDEEYEKYQSDKDTFIRKIS